MDTAEQSQMTVVTTHTWRLFIEVLLVGSQLRCQQKGTNGARDMSKLDPRRRRSVPMTLKCKGEPVQRLLRIYRVCSVEVDSVTERLI